MAQAALLTLDAMNAAVARSWLKDGHKIFNEVTQRFLIMAGLKKHTPTTRNSDVKANRKRLAAQLALMGAKKK